MNVRMNELQVLCILLAYVACLLAQIDYIVTIAVLSSVTPLGQYEFANTDVRQIFTPLRSNGPTLVSSALLSCSGIYVVFQILELLRCGRVHDVCNETASREGNSLKRSGSSPTSGNFNPPKKRRANSDGCRSVRGLCHNKLVNPINTNRLASSSKDESSSEKHHADSDSCESGNQSCRKNYVDPINANGTDLSSKDERSFEKLHDDFDGCESGNQSCRKNYVDPINANGTDLSSKDERSFEKLHDHSDSCESGNQSCQNKVVDPINTNGTGLPSKDQRSLETFHDDSNGCESGNCLDPISSNGTELPSEDERCLEKFHDDSDGCESGNHSCRSKEKEPKSRTTKKLKRIFTRKNKKNDLVEERANGVLAQRLGLGSQNVPPTEKKPESRFRRAINKFCSIFKKTDGKKENDQVKRIRVTVLPPPPAAPAASNIKTRTKSVKNDGKLSAIHQKQKKVFDEYEYRRRLEDIAFNPWFAPRRYRSVTRLPMKEQLARYHRENPDIPDTVQAERLGIILLQGGAHYSRRLGAFERYTDAERQELRDLRSPEQKYLREHFPDVASDDEYFEQPW